MPDALFSPSAAGPDVALDQGRVLLAQLGLVHRLDLCRLQLALEPLLVDLPVARQPHRHRLAGAVGVLEDHEHVLEGVAGMPGAVVAGVTSR